MVIQPYALLVPGDVLSGTTERKSVTLVNQSRSPVDFEWIPVSEPHLIQVEPPAGVVPAGTSLHCVVGITGCAPGKLEAILECVIDRMESRLTLPVEASVKGKAAHEVEDVEFDTTFIINI